MDNILIFNLSQADLDSIFVPDLNKMEQVRETHYSNLLKTPNKTLKLETIPNVCCWWCKEIHKITDTVQIPFREEDTKYSAYGYFDSYQCALAFNNNMGLTNREKSACYLNIRYKKKFKQKLHEALPYYILKEYGGQLTREEYNAFNVKNMVDYHSFSLKPYIDTAIDCNIKIKVGLEYNTQNFNNDNTKEFNLFPQQHD